MEVVVNHLQPGPDGHAAVYTKHLKGIGMEHPREVAVLVVGGGGRCHAIVDALSRSPQVGKIYCAPGNAGIAAQAECVPLKDTQVEQLRDFALEKGVDLTVVGPEVALAAGITDAFTAAGLRIFGPTKAAAVIESSKDFAKQLMAKYNVPTAAYRTFEDYNEALEYVSKGPFPVVLKYDGLAAGKGVVIPETLEEADHTLRDMLLDDKFGKGKVVVEEFLTGPEFSFMCFVDGERVWPMALSQDHKRAYEGDKGPNGIKVIEFNCRFGDPETEVVLPLLKTDIYDIFSAVADGSAMPEIKWEQKSSMGFVMASKGYPGSYEKGFPIEGLEDALSDPEVRIYHMGTAVKDGKTVTSGGRVLMVIGSGDTLLQARDRALTAVDKIRCDNLFWRRDIGWRVL